MVAQTRKEKADEQRKALSLKKNYTVYEPNPLLTVQDSMTNIWQHRFLRAYLCKVDPKKPETFQVEFSLQEFLEVVDLKSISSVKELKDMARSMMKVDFDFVEYREKYGLKKKGSEALIDVINLFERFSVIKNTAGEYVVTVSPTRPMEEMLRNCQQKNGVGYVSYEIGNTLPMSKPHRMRLYELLKRFEDKGFLTIALDDLKAYMGLKGKYNDARNFTKLLKMDIQEINRNTDLMITYGKNGKGKGGAIVGFTFTIKTQAQATQADSTKRTKKATAPTPAEIPAPAAPEPSEPIPTPMPEPQTPPPAPAAPAPAAAAVPVDGIPAIYRNAFPDFAVEDLYDIQAAVEIYYANMDLEPTERQIAAYLSSKSMRLRRQSRRQPIPNPAGYIIAIIEREAEAALMQRAESTRTGRTEMVPEWMASGQRDLSPDELDTIRRMMAEEEPAPATAATDPAVAAMAEALKNKLQK